MTEDEACDRGSCAGLRGHEGTCAEASGFDDADEPDGAPMHRWEVTEGWQPRRENLHDEHNAEGWRK